MADLSISLLLSLAVRVRSGVDARAETRKIDVNLVPYSALRIFKFKDLDPLSVIDRRCRLPILWGIRKFLLSRSGGISRRAE